jgi:hypothetical protein
MAFEPPAIIRTVRLAPFTLKKYYENSNDFATLTWSIRMGYPRINIWLTNKKDELGKIGKEQVITAPFDYITSEMFFKLLQDIITSDPGSKISIECYNASYVNNEKTDDIILQSKVIFGKDDTGVIYIGLTDGNKPKVKFELLHPNKFHKFNVNNKDLMLTKSEASKLFATAYLNSLINVIRSEAVKDTVKDTVVNRDTKRAYKSNTQTSTTDIDELII